MKPIMNDVPNPGLPQGFVKFGTLAHKILVMIHQDKRRKWTSYTRIVQALMDEGVNSDHVAATLQRLARWDYIFPRGKYGVREGLSKKPQTKWALTPGEDPPYKIITSAEGSKRWRDRLDPYFKRAPSIFHVGSRRIWHSKTSSRSTSTQSRGS